MITWLCNQLVESFPETTTAQQHCLWHYCVLCFFSLDNKPGQHPQMDSDFSQYPSQRPSSMSKKKKKRSLSYYKDILSVFGLEVAQFWPCSRLWGSPAPPQNNMHRMWSKHSRSPPSSPSLRKDPDPCEHTGGRSVSHEQIKHTTVQASFLSYLENPVADRLICSKHASLTWAQKRHIPVSWCSFTEQFRVSECVAHRNTWDQCNTVVNI